MELEKKINIFNDIWYKNCFLNAIITVIDYFSGNILDFMAHDLCSSYMYVDNGNIAYTTTNGDKNELDILNEIGISVLGFREQIDDELIISLLDGKKLVVCFIDCFFESLRYDTFNKNHWPHAILVYGYEEEYFKIIESEFINDVKYKRRKIRKKELVECIYGYNNNFNLHGMNYLIYAFYKDEKFVEAKKYYIEKVLYTINHHVLRLKSCDKIMDYINDIGRMKDASQLDIKIRYLNSLINNLQVERYIYAKFFQGCYDNNYLSVYDDSLRLWKSIRAIVARCFFSGAINDEKYNNKLNNIALELIANEKERILCVKKVLKLYILDKLGFLCIDIKDSYNWKMICCSKDDINNVSLDMGARNNVHHMWKGITLPKSDELIMVKNVVFKFPLTGRNVNDSIACEGQMIKCNADKIYKSLYLLSMAFDGAGVFEKIKVNYVDGSYEVKKTLFKEWYLLNASTDWKYTELKDDNTETALVGKHNSDFSDRALFINCIELSNKIVDSIEFPFNPDIYIFCMTLGGDRFLYD